MNLNFKAGLFLIALAFAICLLFFNVRFIGFASNVPSSVTIESKIIVNSSLFEGSTTNFSNMTNAQLEDIVNLTLDKIEYGKIIFSENVNLKQNAENGFIDLNKYVNIDYNKIEVDTNELTGLEKPAVLYLYGLSFSNPRIMRDGEVCPDSICQKISYSSGILIFSVTGFTAYNAEETPLEEETSQTTSGGGGSKSVLVRNFSVDKDLIKVSIKQGETAREIILIKNTGDTPLDFNLSADNVGNFVAMSEEYFTVASGEAKSINLDFFARENEAAEAYAGRIAVRAGDLQKIVNVIIEIREKTPLFDIITKATNHVLFPGSAVRADIKMTNMGDLQNIDVLLYYAIKDFEGNIITSKEESLAVNKQLEVTRDLTVPENLAYGKYVFYSRISYGKNMTAASSDSFEIVSRRSLIYKNLVIISIVLIVIVVAAYLILAFIKKKRKIRV